MSTIARDAEHSRAVDAGVHVARAADERVEAPVDAATQTTRVRGADVLQFLKAEGRSAKNIVRWCVCAWLFGAQRTQ